MLVPPPKGMTGFVPRANSEVLARNSRYAFELTRPGGADEWRLRQYLDAPSAEPAAQSLSPERLRKNTSSTRSFETSDTTLLTDLFVSPGFKATSCGPSPADPALIRVTFEHSPPTQPRRVPTRTAGWYDLNPAAGWSVREAEETIVTGKDGIAVRSHLVSDFDQATGAVFTREVRSETRLTRSGQLINHHSTAAKYRMWFDSGVPEREFSLTAYGLPEPPGVEFKRRTPTYVWLLLGAAGCIVLALVFRRLARRPAVPSAP